METIQQQIGALQVIVAKQQVSVKRQRFAIIALAGIIVTGGFIAAGRPTGDATFDIITCKGWRVVDKDEKARIIATTHAEGDAIVYWRDKNGKQRIHVSTGPEGDASVTLMDKNEKMRIAVSTSPDGYAGVDWSDKDGKQRIDASIEADGTVSLPTKDLSPPKKP